MTFLRHPEYRENRFFAFKVALATYFCPFKNHKKDKK
jgi:hypothetical protein